MCGGPEWVVLLGRERQVGRRVLPDHSAAQPQLAAALELRDAVVHVVQRDHADAEEALGRHSAVLDQPVVEDLETRFLQLGVIQEEKLEALRRVEDLPADAVDRHLLDSLGGVPRPRVAVDTDPFPRLRVAWRAVAQSGRQPLLPQV
jgi:hypothetical protein